MTREQRGVHVDRHQPRRRKHRDRENSSVSGDHQQIRLEGFQFAQELFGSDFFRFKNRKAGLCRRRGDLAGFHRESAAPRSIGPGNDGDDLEPGSRAADEAIENVGRQFRRTHEHYF